MAKNKEIKKETDEMRDAREFAEMYSKLNTADKYQVKGIMIGLQIRDKMEKCLSVELLLPLSFQILLKNMILMLLIRLLFLNT